MATQSNHSESSNPLSNQVDTRELRFRAWNGTAMYWPDYIVNDEGGFPMNQTGGEEINDAFQCTDDPLMQYTGLKDKNGVKIYEGDLLRNKDSKLISEVVFKDGTFWLTNEMFFSPLGELAHDVEVFSHIYADTEVTDLVSYDSADSEGVTNPQGGGEGKQTDE